MLVGQDTVYNLIDSFSINTLPHAIRLIGERGSGRHTIKDYISSKFSMDNKVIDSKLTEQDIFEMSLCVKPTIYFIDSDKLTYNCQVSLLKTIEEPMSNVYIVIISLYDGDVIDTVSSRCYTIKLNKYSKDSLKLFLNGNKPETIIDYVSTPGQVIMCDVNKLLETINLSTLIISKIGYANVSSILSISKKFSKDFENALDIKLFSKVLVVEIKKEIARNTNPKLIEAYKLSTTFNYKVNTTMCDSTRALEKFLFELRNILKAG